MLQANSLRSWRGLGTDRPCARVSLAFCSLRGMPKAFCTSVAQLDPVACRYERMNRVNNYSVDACGITHITVGDAGAACALPVAAVCR